ncbi:hypothetical protein [Rhizobium leguminosarum]|uniref:hypothetical protein n=1 Tax=Rhizobium leguminosarum TaxID=384 RepID=UPI001C92A1E0|nr:hypothetical protein [Rhizobium leguminosarum]MBY3044828.1 hypothetical protein [Rhizobium leguminosarum]
MTTDPVSPHYFVLLNRKYRGSNLFYSIAQCDADQLTRAWNAVQWLAAKDLDHAADANGFGFNKSDTTIGHRAARASLVAAHRNEMLAIVLLKLARKYRRQLPPRYLVDQPQPCQPKLDV